MLANSQGRLQDRRPLSIIDIGSNSIRLVVYEGIARSPTVLFNEKMLAGLGRGIVTTGKGVTIHTIDCETLEQFADNPDRWLDVSWDRESDPIRGENSYVDRIEVQIGLTAGDGYRQVDTGDLDLMLDAVPPGDVLQSFQGTRSGRTRSSPIWRTRCTTRPSTWRSRRLTMSPSAKRSTGRSTRTRCDASEAALQRARSRATSPDPVAQLSLSIPRSSSKA
jgi:hypothetical protein